MLTSLKNHPLFRNISEENIKLLTDCLDIYEKEYLKNEYIILENNKIDFIGIVTQGSIYMEQEDFFGNKYFFTSMPKNNLFGEIFISYDIIDCSVNYRATTNCKIIFIRYASILNKCQKSCIQHSQLIENLINLMAYKSRILIEKIGIISKSTIRQRLITYFKILSKKQKTNTIISNLNHTELADYICANRSSMLRELKNMEKDGLIKFKDNTYHLSNLSDTYFT